MQAPRYQPSIDSVEALKKGSAPMALGSFTVKPGLPASIGLRGSQMSSPVGSDYAAYLADALALELKLAGRLDPQSTVVVSGVLLKNDIAAGGLSTNSGEIEARIAVLNKGTPRYEKVLRAELSWDSSFLGSVAIPKAQQQYPALVQKLLNDHDDRLFFACIVVIAANAGGAWSPIGDVTTTMLWIGGQITSLADELLKKRSAVYRELAK